MAAPTLVRSAGNSAGNGTDTVIATLSAGATAGNCIFMAVAADKNAGSPTFSDNVNTSGSNWNIEISKLGASVSVYFGWKVAAGGETAIKCVTANTTTSGLSGNAGELSQAGTGAWDAQAISNPTYSDTAVTSRALGTTSPASPVDALGIAFCGIDTASNRGSTVSWTGATELYSTPINPSGTDGGCGGIYTATTPIMVGETDTVSFSHSGSSDQLSGGIVALGRNATGGGGGGTVSLPLAFVATASTATGTTSVTPAAWPTGTQTNDIVYAWVHTKANANTNASIATPSGWTLVGQYGSTIAISSTAPGVGTGPTRLWLYRIQITGSVPALPTWNVTNGNAVQATLRTYRPSEGGGTINELFFTGNSINTSSTNLGASVAVSAGVITAGDEVEVAWGIADDDGTTLTTSSTPTLAGVTFGTWDVGPTHSITGNGNDAAFAARFGDVSSGTNTGTTMTMTATAGAANTAVVAAFRVRVTKTTVAAPVVNAGANATVTQNVAFTRTATETNSPTSRSWTIVSGPSGVTPGTQIGTAAALSYTPTIVGSYVLRYSATNAGGTGTDDLTLTVNPPAPVASAGADATITVNTVWNRTGTGTNSPTSYQWNLITAPAGATTGLLDSDNVLAYTPTIVGTYTFRFSAINGGGTGTDDVVLTVNPAAPVSDAGADATISLGAAFTRTGVGTNSPTSYAWTLIAAPAGVTTGVTLATTAALSYTPTVAGSYTLRFASTNAGGTGTDDVVLTVNANPPVANAGADATVVVNTAFTRTGSGTNSPTSYSWQVISAPAGVTTPAAIGSAAALSYTPTIVGSYTLRLTATNAGGSGTDDLVLTVNPPAPVVNAGADTTIVVNTVFSRTATENNSPTSRAWTIVSGPTGVGTTIGTAAALSWTPSTTGVYVLRYAATNATGTGTDDVQVTVVYPAPSVDAGTDVTGFPVNTQFTRTATDNGNGATITARSWTIQTGPSGVGSTIGTAAALAWTPSVTGSYVLRYSATSSGGVGQDDISIAVVLPAPTADAGVDATVLANQVFSRTATETGSSVTARAWTIVSGPAGTGTTIGTAAALSWTPSVVGTYVIRYSITNATATATDDAAITVVAPPTVNAGADATITNRTPFARAATENDNNSAITARSWKVQAGPDQVGQTLSNTTTVNWTPTVPGSYTLRYSATNGSGTSFDDLILTVAAVVYGLNGVAEASSGAVARIETAGKMDAVNVLVQTSLSSAAKLRVAQRQRSTAAIITTISGRIEVAGRVRSTTTANATAVAPARRRTRLAGSSLATSSTVGRVEVAGRMRGTTAANATASAVIKKTRPMRQAIATAIATGIGKTRPVTRLNAENMLVQSRVVRANLEIPVPWVGRAVSSISGKLARVPKTSKTILSVGIVVGTPAARKIGVMRNSRVTADTTFVKKSLKRLPILRAYPLRAYGDASARMRVVNRYFGQRAQADGVVPPSDTTYTSRLKGTALTISNAVGRITRTGKIKGRSTSLAASSGRIEVVTRLAKTITAQTVATPEPLARIRPIAGRIDAVFTAQMRKTRRVHGLHQEAQANSTGRIPNLKRVIRYTRYILRAEAKFGERPPRFVQVTDQGEGRARVRSYREVIKVRGVAASLASARGKLIWAPKRHPARAISSARGKLKPIRVLRVVVRAQTRMRHRFIIVPRMTDIVRYYPLPGEAVSSVDTDLDLIPDQLDPYPTVYNFFVLR